MKIFNRVLQNPNYLNVFIKNVLVLFSGTFISQLIVVSLSPILSRIYTPENFGVLAIYSSIFSIVVMIGSLRYELAIPLPLKDHDAAEVLILCLSLSIVIFVIVFFMITIVLPKIQCISNIEIPLSYFFILPIGIFLGIVFQVFIYWSIRFQYFKIIAEAKILQSLTINIIPILIQWIGPFALLLGHALGLCVGLTRMFPTVYKKRKILYQCKLTNIMKTAYFYRNFPLYSTWSVLFNSLGWQFPNLIIARYYSQLEAGLLFFVFKSTSAPIVLIGNSISQALLSRVTETDREGSLKLLVSSIQFKLIVFSMPLFTLLYLTGPEIFTYIFGEEWGKAGEVACVLSPMLYFQFIISPLAIILEVLNKNFIYMILQFILMIFRISSFGIAIIFKEDFIFGVKLFSILSILSYLSFLVLLYYTLKLNWISLILRFIMAMLYSLLSVGPVILKKYFCLGNNVSVHFILFSLIFYAILSYGVIKAKKRYLIKGR